MDSAYPSLPTDQPSPVPQPSELHSSPSQ
jgi:hypothetical protein